MDFNGVYVNVKWSWSSGANDAQILTKAQEMHYKEKKKTFKNISFWSVLKDKEKWLKQYTSEDFTGSSTRTKTFEKTLIVNLQMHMLE